MCGHCTLGKEGANSSVSICNHFRPIPVLFSQLIFCLGAKVLRHVSHVLDTKWVDHRAEAQRCFSATGMSPFSSADREDHRTQVICSTLHT